MNKRHLKSCVYITISTASESTTRLSIYINNMLSWLVKSSRSPRPVLPKPRFTELPDPNDAKAEDADVVLAANSEVEKTLADVNKRKRGDYSAYTPELRVKIAKYATEHGNTRAARHFSKELGRTINESTIRSIKTRYLTATKTGTVVTELPNAKRGRPLLLGVHDDTVVEYVKSIRECGGVINRAIVISAAEGVLMAKNRGLLSKYGGPVELTRGWAESFLGRLGYVKRKGTKAARKVPDDFVDQKTKFLDTIARIVKEHSIPDELVINFDQTGISIVPVSNWTMAAKGTKQVELLGIEDKRQITILLGCTLSGDLIPPQLLYTGTTDKCHPKVKFPEGWDIHHTANHWSNEDSMVRYVESVLAPYVSKTRKRLGLPENQPALIIHDVFRAHRVESFSKALRKNNMYRVLVPAGCTGELQPLDLSVNGVYKDHMKNAFSNFYADEITRSLNKGLQPHEIKIDLKLTTFKPLNANWIIQSFDKIRQNRNEVIRGWKEAGIKTAVADVHSITEDVNQERD